MFNKTIAIQLLQNRFSFRLQVFKSFKYYSVVERDLMVSKHPTPLTNISSYFSATSK